jgi:DNA ligase (NAD+)
MLNKEETEQLLLKYNKAYRTGEALVSDSEYNDLLDEYKCQFPEDYEQFKLKLFDISDASKIKGKVKLPFITGSLNKAKYNEGALSLNYYIAKFLNATGVDPTADMALPVSIMPKLDGCSMTLIYKDGVLHQALTRGDGFYGEDKTAHARLIPSIPQEWKYIKYAVIKGEVIMKHDNWKKVQTMVNYSSSRNAVAGILNHKTPNEALCKNLLFVGYRLLDVEIEPSMEEQWKEACTSYSLSTLKSLYKGLQSRKTQNNNWLRNLERYSNNTAEITFLELSNWKGVTIYNHIEYHNWSYPMDPDTLENCKNIYHRFLRNLDYNIDGIVVDMNQGSLFTQDLNAYYPTSMFAIKFDMQSNKGILQSIEWEVSKSGALKPVAVLSSPIHIGDVEVQRCTLYNARYIEDHVISSGCVLTIMRSGDVIPKCISVCNRQSSYAVLPSVCPVCGTTLERSGVDLVCSNVECPGRQVKEVVDFLRKLNIDFIAENTLISFGISTISGILSWKKPASTKLYTRFEEELKKMWKASKEQIWAALNWEGIALETWKKVFAFISLDALKSALDQGIDDVLTSIKDNVFGVGSKTIEQMKAAWPKLKPCFEGIIADSRYQNAEYNFVTLPKSAVFLDKSICFSGSFLRKKATLAKLAELNGATVKTSFARSTCVNILVTNTDVHNVDNSQLSAKEKIALMSNRCEIIDEKTFIERCEIKEVK